MKILVVLPRFPYPLEKGDKLRAYNQIRCLSRNNEVYLFCVSHEYVSQEHIEVMRKYCKDIVVVRLNKMVSYKNVVRNFCASKSVQIGYWDSKRSRKVYKEFERQVEPDVLYSQMLRTLPLVARSSVPKVMDFQDSLSMNMERRMAQYHWGLHHFLFHFEFKMLRSTEYNSFKIFDALTIISNTDSEAIPHHKNGEIQIVPNGVDFDYFHPIECEKKYDVAFCGNMQYAPNVNVAIYLAEKVMPYVWKTIPEAKLLLAGATPKASVKRLASDKITVLGSVKDIRSCYSSAKVFAAPMRLGSGLQNKLLEAMAMRIPCVTSTIANNALGAAPEQDILIGDKAEDVADHIIDLLQSKQERDTLAENGYNFVHKNYSWETFGKKLETILYNASNKKV